MKVFTALIASTSLKSSITGQYSSFEETLKTTYSINKGNKALNVTFHFDETLSINISSDILLTVIRKQQILRQRTTSGYPLNEFSIC